MAIESAIPEKDRPSAKKPRTTAAAFNPTPVEVDEEQSTPIGKGESRGPLSMTLPDPDLLDCPICFQPLCSSVYQCENGHIACGSCCTTTLKNECSNCSLPIGHIRNMAIEKVLESVRVACQYTLCGCPEMLSYSNKVAHEKACNYVPCSCPCCDFVGNSKFLYDHFALKHKDSSKEFKFGSRICIPMAMDATQTHVILREGKGVLFILNRCVEAFGSFFNVVCVAPPASKKISYELIAKIGDDLMRLNSSVEMMSEWTALTPSKMSLVVPSNFVSTSQPLHLELIIGKKKKPSLFFDSDDSDD